MDFYEFVKNDLEILWGQSTRFWKVQDVYFEMIEISKFLGTMGTIEVCKDFAKNSVFRLFHEHVGHPDGTQVVPKISKLENMMFKLSNALSDVLIRLLEPDSEKVEIS